MLNIVCESKFHAVEQFNKMRQYQPFKYNNCKWYLIYIDGIGYFRKTEKSILNIIKKKGNKDWNYEYYIILPY